MGKEKMIYSKRFPIEQELEEEMENSNDIQKCKPRYATGEEFVNHLINDSKYVPIPARLKKKDIFIRRVVELSEVYEIDADIEEREGQFSATLHIIPCLFEGGLKEMFNGIIQMADDIAFFLSRKDPDKIIISLSYYTHDHYISGKKIRSLS